MDRRYRLHLLGNNNGRTYSIVVQNQNQVKIMKNFTERVNYLLIEYGNASGTVPLLLFGTASILK